MSKHASTQSRYVPRSLPSHKYYLTRSVHKEPLHKAGRLPSVKHFVLLGAKQARTSLAPFAYYETLVSAASPHFAFDENLPENAALGLCYTSGTTGMRTALCVPVCVVCV